MSESTVSVFISWSGEPSRVVAQALATFINDCIQASAPWTSDDIPKGAAWPDAILTRLQESALGIVCVTRENQTSPWLLFEGGALAKHKTLHVFLIDAKAADIKPPLGLYQITLAQKAEVLKLLSTIDAKVPDAHRRGSDRLRKDCDKNWPELENAIEQARGLLQTASPAPRRGDRELLEEILTTVRALGKPDEESAWLTEEVTHPGVGRGAGAVLALTLLQTRLNDLGFAVALSALRKLTGEERDFLYSLSLAARRGVDPSAAMGQVEVFLRERGLSANSSAET